MNDSPFSTNEFEFTWTITGRTVIRANDRATAKRKFDNMSREAMLRHAKSTEFTLTAEAEPVRG